MFNEKINRVVLIGAGAVGCSYAYSMINQGGSGGVSSY